MYGSIARASCACLLLSGVGTAGHAQDEDLPGGPPLDLSAALERTLERNPDLRAFGFEIEGAQARVLQAGLQPNPELGIALQDVLGTDGFRGVKSAETTVTLGWVLERGLRARLVDTARAGAALYELDAEVIRLDAAAETARRYLDCLAYQGRLANATQAVRFAQETVRLIAERVAAGAALEAESERAEADLVRAELVQEDYQHELVSAYHRLSAQWGETEPDFDAVQGDAAALPVLEPFEALLARVEANPDLLRLMTQQRVAAAELELARAAARPSWHVSAGLRRFEATDDVALVGGLTVPLPIRNRNQGRIAEARAQMAHTEAALDASRVRIETTLFTLHQELNHHLQVGERLRADVVPRLERALVDTRRAYELGRYAYTEWRTVQADLLAASNEVVEAGVSAQRILVEIERLTGVRASLPAAQ